MKLFKTSVRENRELAKNHYRLTLHPSETTKRPEPGNFFMLSVSNGLDPLLKRPFSIHRILGDDLQFLYRVVGKGTEILSSRKPGDTIEVLGPLGNSFPVRKSNKNIVLVAGGLGIAPIVGLAEKISHSRQFLKKSDEMNGPLLFYGAKTKNEVMCREDLESLNIKPIISTDDGTFGIKGNIVTCLKRYFSRHKLMTEGCTLYACGPEMMLKSLSSFTAKKGIHCFAALEQNMACGVGTCLGCVVNTKKGYRRVCKEGPVFPIEEIIWDKL